jgi:hypothetical protein
LAFSHNSKRERKKDMNITLADLSQDEIAACCELVEKMRTAKKKAALIEEARQKLFIEYNNCIETIGVEETRKIIQEINRLLRAVNDD